MTTVASEQPYTRFIRKRSHITREKPPAAKWQAFQPRLNPLSSQPETSVYRTDGLTEEGIWAVGEEHVPRHRPDLPHPARADLSAGDVTAACLVLDPNETPPRHADVIAWPDPNQDKHAMMNRAQILASKSRCVLNPASGRPEATTGECEAGP